MGCDIHVYAEQLVDGEWRHVGGRDEWDEPQEFELLSDRWYPMFAVLAGVRNRWGIKPIVEQRRTPADMSEETFQAAEFYAPDGHHYSWITAQEFKDYDWIGIALQNPLFSVSFPKEVRRALQGFKEIDENLDHVRIVFWFDS